MVAFHKKSLFYALVIKSAADLARLKPSHIIPPPEARNVIHRRDASLISILMATTDIESQSIESMKKLRTLSYDREL
jgi:hypothetical protein